LIYNKIVKKAQSPLKSKIPQVLFTALLLIAGVLLFLLVVGTVYAFVRSPGTGPLFRLGKPAEAAVRETAAPTGETRVFSGLGRLRIPLVNSSTLILTIAFPYSADDAAFAEELAAKIGDFRAIASGYFSALPEESVIYFNEETAKQELLRRLNEDLRLGRISELYFSDFMIID
jgi:flagellar basal body-associated protein FliL